MAAIEQVLTVMIQQLPTQRTNESQAAAGR